MYFLLEKVNFHCHVSLLEFIWQNILKHGGESRAPINEFIVIPGLEGGGIPVVTVDGS